MLRKEAEMDDHIAAASPEEAFKFPGRKIIPVSVFNADTGDFELRVVTWKGYVNLLDRGILRFQIEKTKRPPYQPDRETALRWAQIVRAARKPPAVAKKNLEKWAKKRAANIAVLEEAAAELKKTKKQLFVAELLRVAAKKLKITTSGLRSFFYLRIPEEKRNEWLYGDATKLTRRELKFGILKEVREEMRARSESRPRKIDLATEAAKRLGMEPHRVSVFIGEHLLEEEVKALDLEPWHKYRF